MLPRSTDPWADQAAEHAECQAAEHAAHARATEHARRLDGEAVGGPTETCSKIKCHTNTHPLGGYSDHLAVMRRSPRWARLAEWVGAGDVPSLLAMSGEERSAVAAKAVPEVRCWRDAWGAGLGAAVEEIARGLFAEMMDAEPERRFSWSAEGDECGEFLEDAA